MYGNDSDSYLELPIIENSPTMPTSDIIPVCRAMHSYASFPTYTRNARSRFCRSNYKTQFISVTLDVRISACGPLAYLLLDENCHSITRHNHHLTGSLTQYDGRHIGSHLLYTYIN